MWLKVRDIYRVKTLIGHQSITMTEKYAKFNPRRLAKDFPTLATDFENSEKSHKNAVVDTVSVDPEIPFLFPPFTKIVKTD